MFLSSKLILICLNVPKQDFQRHHPPRELSQGASASRYCDMGSESASDKRTCYKDMEIVMRYKRGCKEQGNTKPETKWVEKETRDRRKSKKNE